MGPGSGQIMTFCDDAPAHGWSTTKVCVLTAFLQARGRRGLTPAEPQEAYLAITESDNQDPRSAPRRQELPVRDQ